MARRSYSSEVEAYVDAELAAREATLRGSLSVSEGVSLTVLGILRMNLARDFRLYRGTALLALLPVLVIASRAGLNVLPQLGIAPDSWLPWALQGITIAAAVWAGLVTLWQARNSWRRARGLPLVALRFRRDQTAAERQRYADYPSFEDLVIKLGAALATLPALLWLALSGGDPHWLLVALPLAFLLAAVLLVGLLNGLIGGLGAVGSVDRPIPGPQPSSQIGQLDDRIAQLQQIRVWLKDEKLKSMIDDAIGKQVARSERRQVAYSVAVGVFSLAAGWLLSAISPVSALAQLLPR
jgi:hypothetical protein